MNREEIIDFLWKRMLAHDTYSHNEASLIKAFECKQILNKICTPAELRKLQEGGKL